MSISDIPDYLKRHIGPSETDLQAMLARIGVASLDQLVSETIPEGIRLKKELVLREPISEQSYLRHVRTLANRNQVYRNYIGLGYYGTLTPTVILRNIFENPGWYTQYTPYQSEISQGRLEALINYQTMVADITGMEIANASLLDEATAAAEAMTMLHRMRKGGPVKRGANTFFVSNRIFPQTLTVLKSRAEPMGISIEVGDLNGFQPTEKHYAVLLQFPDAEGCVADPQSKIKELKAAGQGIVVASDLMSLLLLKPPGEWGADVVVGSTQRFGVPMGYGGPHAAFFATSDPFKRSMPGRLIGVSVDADGKPAYRLTLQTREQHIRREKATSNICTAQALLAIMAGMYAVYHGPHGLRQIAQRIHNATVSLATHIRTLGFKQNNQNYFDTLLIQLDTTELETLRTSALNHEINLGYFEGVVRISLDETVSTEDLLDLMNLFSELAGKSERLAVHLPEYASSPQQMIPDTLQRKSEFLQHPVFNQYHNETLMMRYIKGLENRDLALNTAMIPLGSCTMKLNPATAMIPLSWPEFANLHPYSPDGQAAGYLEMLTEFASDLAKITGLAATSLQPNSGAQGEYTGLMVIRAFLRAKGQIQRDVALIPTSAHGTNPASAVMAGMQVVLIQCDSEGNIDLEDLNVRVQKHKEQLACLMVTYPSTHGVFEESIRDVCKLIHEHGGQVYMDGANMNAQVGLTSPGEIGADVCHLNLHKTFSIPHGGGGPGMGPICVAEHLKDFLPGHPLPEYTLDKGGTKQTSRAIPAVAAAPYASASILLISYAYIKMLGASGMRRATETAILNANYLKSRLEKDFKVLYCGTRGRIAHEMILDFRDFKAIGIEVEDVAKRLIDYGFHAPTMSWPVPGTLMVEPTESEPLFELDRFCDAMLQIRKEIQAIEDGKVPKECSVLKNAPHPAHILLKSDWPHSYSREEAAYPLAGQANYKFWPPVSRVDNVYGDRNLFCTCPPQEDFE